MSLKQVRGVFGNQIQEAFLMEEADGTTWLVGYGEYPRSSVLAGQPFERLLEPFESLEEAKAKYPTFRVEAGRSAVQASVPDTAPEGFDPADIGESW